MNNYIITDAQSEIVKKIATRLEITPSEVVSSLVEIGGGFCAAYTQEKIIKYGGIFSKNRDAVTIAQAFTEELKNRR